MATVEQQKQRLSETVSLDELQIGVAYKLHFMSREGKETVTVGANYIFEGREEGRLRFAVLFDGRMKNSKRQDVVPNHLDLPELLFNRGVFAEPIIGKPYNEAAVKYNPRGAQDLIAGLPPRLWMFPG